MSVYLSSHGTLYYPWHTHLPPYISQRLQDWVPSFYEFQPKDLDEGRKTGSVPVHLLDATFQNPASPGKKTTHALMVVGECAVAEVDGWGSFDLRRIDLSRLNSFTRLDAQNPLYADRQQLLPLHLRRERPEAPLWEIDGEPRYIARALLTEMGQRAEHGTAHDILLDATARRVVGFDGGPATEVCTAKIHRLTFIRPEDSAIYAHARPHEQRCDA